MLARLSIRDIVLIDRLDLEFTRGLSVLTHVMQVTLLTQRGAAQAVVVHVMIACGGQSYTSEGEHGTGRERRSLIGLFRRNAGAASGPPLSLTGPPGPFSQKV